MDYLHTNGSLLVSLLFVETYMGNLSQIGVCTFNGNMLMDIILNVMINGGDACFSH